MKKEITLKVLTFTSFILPTILLGMWILSTFFLPENVALHFNASGKADRIGPSSELIALGIVYYLIPLIMVVIFANIKPFLSKVIGLTGSIVVSLSYIGVSISNLIKAFNASGRGTTNGGLWTSFALTLIAVATIIASHVLININSNLIFKKQAKLMTKNEQFNKINLTFSILLFLFALTVSIGCAILKNYYSFIILFISALLFGSIFYLAQSLLLKKKRVSKVLESNKSNG